MILLNELIISEERSNVPMGRRRMDSIVGMSAMTTRLMISDGSKREDRGTEGCSVWVHGCGMRVGRPCTSPSSELRIPLVIWLPEDGAVCLSVKVSYDITIAHWIVQ